MARVASAIDEPRAKRSRGRRRSKFHLGFAGAIAALMLVGFPFDAEHFVFHPVAPRPAILFWHALVATLWMVTYFTQALLIPAGKLAWHRRLGWLGAGLALAMPPLGIATALAMRRFDLAHFPSSDPARDLSFLAAPLADIVAFTPCAWLGIAMRKRPDWHRRLMYLSTAAIAEAGFGRIPIPGMANWFFLGNFVLYGLTIANDIRLDGRIHPVNRWAVPLIMADESIAMLLWFMHPAWWQATARTLLGLG